MGYTPLMSAVIRGSVDTIRVLLGAKADVNLVPELASGSALVCWPKSEFAPLALPGRCGNADRC